MHNLIKASLYKLFRDKTFIVTAIIGVVLAALILGINALTESLSGNSMLLGVSSPGSNFGLTIPVNLVVFTVGEFTYGTVRNKIIAGLSKTKIFFGLYITGLVFTFILFFGYALITVGIASLAGGFNAEAIGGIEFILPYIAYIILSYAFITAISIFFSVLIRQIGGSITIVIILLVFLSMLPLVIYASNAGSLTSPDHWSMWINPIYMSGFYGNNVVSILSELGGGMFGSLFKQKPQMIAAGIVTPSVWTAIFLIGGLLIFKHSDVK